MLCGGSHRSCSDPQDPAKYVGKLFLSPHDATDGAVRKQIVKVLNSLQRVEKDVWSRKHPNPAGGASHRR